MQSLLEKGKDYYTPKKRPSGHDISSGFMEDKGGSIPSNLLQISNTESNTPYLRYCKASEIESHPARFPSKLPEFFIKFLTDSGDIVLDIFAGSNTTGAVAENLGWHWLAFELEHSYLAASIFRFSGDLTLEQAQVMYKTLGESTSSSNTVTRSRLYTKKPATNPITSPNIKIS